MTYLEKLRAADTFSDVAKLLGYSPSGLAYILYKLPPAAKYTQFEIPKRSGGTRVICAPIPQLKLLQRRLANVLYACLDDIEIHKRRSLAHGFERRRSILTNAAIHKRRRYVLNLDLADFFPSINFGRVRGFFMRDAHFGLNQKVSTIIAQIACYDNHLPQGSPCSPIISNLVGHILDMRLAHFAKKNKCTYSRYADDITFSTNQKKFPNDIGAPDSDQPHLWRLGLPLVQRIEGAGFKVNDKKTRMQYRGSRQIVTGLLVNEKVNIRPEYYRNARSMCHSLFSTGSFFRPNLDAQSKNAKERPVIKQDNININVLEGILAHIFNVKNNPHQLDDKQERPESFLKLYRRFLFFKHFVDLNAPLLLPEGKTDSIYLRVAIQRLTEFHPYLGQFEDGKFSPAVRFMTYSNTIQNVLEIGHGTGALKRLAATYKNSLKAYKHRPLQFPVIMIVDNDEGPKDLFSSIGKNGGPTINTKSTADFYHISANLYLIKTPEQTGSDPTSRIEDLFAPAVLATAIDGKTFDPDKEHEAPGKYGKFVFAEKVVRPNAAIIDFSGFAPLLSRISAVVEHYSLNRQKLSGA